MVPPEAPRPPPPTWVLGGEGQRPRPKGHTPGLVSRVFSLEGFFSLTCLGRPPTKRGPGRESVCAGRAPGPSAGPPSARATSRGPLGRGPASLT